MPGERDAVDARRIRDVAEDLPGLLIDDHDVRSAGDVDPSRGRIGGEVVGTPLAADSVLLDLESLCGEHAWRRRQNHQRRKKLRADTNVWHIDLDGIRIVKASNLYNGQSNLTGR